MYSLPIIPTENATVSTSPGLHVYQSPYHDPLVLYVNLESNAICILNVAHFSPRKTPPFPCDAENIMELTKKMRLDDNDDDNGGIEWMSNSNKPPQVSGWNIEISDSRQVNEGPNDDKLEACAMGLEGKVIVGVGSRGTVWLWTTS
jgi:polycomb protein EED